MSSIHDSLALPRNEPIAQGSVAALLDVLAARAAAGDRPSFERIYTLLADDLYAYVCGKVQDGTVAEDLIANTFLKAWRSAGRYRSGTDGFRRWIFGIARNEVRDYWRTNHHFLELHDHDVTDESGSEPEGDVEGARRLVHRALATLTEDQRQVVVLRYFDNKSHEEIATMLGKREGAVRALLLRALRRMRKVMDDAALPARAGHGNGNGGGRK